MSLIIRWIIAVLLVNGITAVYAWNAEASITIQSPEGTLELTLPPGWTITEQSAPGEPLRVAFAKDETGSGALTIWNILPVCGVRSRGAADPLMFSCTPEPVDILPYYMQNVIGLGPYGTETFTTSPDGTAYVYHPQYIAAARDILRGNFLMLVVQPWENDDAPAVYSDMQALMDGLVWNDVETPPEQYPQPVYTDDGWSLDISALNRQQPSAAPPLLGADGHIYVRAGVQWEPPAAAVISLEPDGTIYRIVDNAQFYDVRDWVVTAEGIFWVLTTGLHLYRIDAEQNLVQELYASQWIDTISAIELDPDGNLVLLRLRFDEALITIVAPEDTILREFSIETDDFSFSGAEASLSYAVLGVSPAGLIYVYNETVGQVRVFDAEGQIVQPALFAEPTSVTHFSFGPDGSIDIYTHAYEPNQWTVLRYGESGTPGRLPLPDANAIYLPGTDQIIMLAGDHLISLIERSDSDE